MNHEKCINKVRKSIMKENPAIKSVWFELDSIISFNSKKPSSNKKTGQAVTVNFNHTKKDGTVIPKSKKSFVTHIYCPFCGKKFND